jgi:hypothetical protein
MMYSAFRPLNFMARSWETRARASTAGSGNTYTVFPPTRRDEPKRRTSAARSEKAKVRFTCCAQIAPTSISKGSGMRVGLSPWSRATRSPSTGSALAAM